MHCNIYTMRGNRARFSFEEENNQIALGLDKLLPEPRFKLFQFEQLSGRMDFELGRDGVLLSNSENHLVLGNQMRATQTGQALGIQIIDEEKTIRVPVERVSPGRFFLIVPRKFYNLRSDVLAGL